jgi:predicted nucleotidyltransferase
MSGSAGGNRIPRTALQNTVNSYIEKVLKNFPGFKSAKISGSYNTTDKQDFGDIDLIVNIESGKDKKIDKQDLVKHLESLSTDVIVPFKSEKNKGKRTLNHGEIVTVLYPIDGVPGEYVQIDNIVSSTEDESDFKKSVLDYPAEKQGLILGLVKAVLLETDPNKVFAKMGITNLDPLEPNQEYEFHVSTAGLSLRKVTLDNNFKTLESTEMWSSSKFDDVKKLLSDYRIDGTFEELIQDVKKLKNPRSKNRVKGWFLKNIRVQAGEMGTPKAEKKQQAIDTVNALQEKYGKLALEIAKPFLFEDENTTIAVFPGKFKPPHKDHLARIQAASAAADSVLVIIGPKPVDSFTADQSLKVFNLYKEKGLVPDNVKFIISDLPSPVLKAYKEFENNPNQQYIAVFGKDDIARFKNIDKLSNVKVDNFEEANIGDLSATNLRNAINLNNPTDIAKFLPQGIEVNDFLNALGYNPRTEPTFNSINENISNSDFTQALASITKYYVDNGYNVKPLPKVKIISNDSNNASNLLGKTAYYNPADKSITLFTFGRHPKDILRSFSHEMIHHIQNLENRLTNITTTNTTEDDYLSQLEQEAYLKGNMTFRNWEDKLK